jgi:hypothetical protein
MPDRSPATPAPQRRTRRLGAFAAVALVVGVYFGAALPVAACDCMALEPMPAYAGQPQWTIFSGTVQLPEANGTPVVVSRWFQGPDAAPVVWIQGTWGTGGASCETPMPPPGSEWIFLASRRDTGELDVNLCTPHAAVASDAGSAMLAEAIATFGGGGAPANPGPGGTAVPESGGPQAPAAPVERAGDAAGTLEPAVLVAVGLGAAALAAGVLLAARRRRRV